LRTVDWVFYFPEPTYLLSSVHLTSSTTFENTRHQAELPFFAFADLECEGDEEVLTASATMTPRCLLAPVASIPTQFRGFILNILSLKGFSKF
jgi:hypothetical protein